MEYIKNSQNLYARSLTFKEETLSFINNLLVQKEEENEVEMT